MKQSPSSKQPRFAPLRVADLDLVFAHREGEGFEAVWRTEHEALWEGHETTGGALVVAERFCVVERS